MFEAAKLYALALLMLPALGEVDSITLMLLDHLGSCTFSRGKMNSEVLPCKHCNSRVPRINYANNYIISVIDWPIRLSSQAQTHGWPSVALSATCVHL